jgi:hypothetical protein
MRLKSELTVAPGRATVLVDSNLQSTGAIDQWYNVGNSTQQRAAVNEMPQLSCNFLKLAPSNSDTKYWLSLIESHVRLSSVPYGEGTKYV